MSSKVATKIKDEREARRRAKLEEKRKARQRKRRQGMRPREIEVRDRNERILVVCEGSKTEPLYFKSFRVRSGVVLDIQGLGMNTDSLVREAVRRREEDKNGYDRVWVVLDRDSFPAKNFNEAISLARSENIRVAHSNEAFELWYLLHFEYCESGLSRQTYKKRLTKHLKKPYKKNDPRMYGTLRAQQSEAIQNSKRLLASHGEGYRPESANPSTTVHLLVDVLNELSR